METLNPPRRASRIVRSVLSAVIAIAALSVFLAWMGGSFRERVRPGEASVTRPSSAGRTLVAVEKLRSDDTVTAVGSVQPKKRAEVASQILATVIDVKVRPGDRVRADQPLVLLDDRELAAQQRETSAALVSANADLATRTSEFERAKKSRAAGGISEDEYGKAEGAYRIAEAQVTRAREAISRLAVQLTHTRIVASGSGLVADRFVDPGDLASPGKPLLSIYDPDNLELHANIPESLAPAVTVGMQLTVQIDAAGLSAKGLVREVVPQAQQASRSVLIKITLPPTPSAKPLLPGMFGRVEIPVGIVERLWVPRLAVMQIGQLDQVEVANPDGTLTRRFVRIGQEVNGRVEVLSGLRVGEQVALPVK
jgi:RND family efflux transporter MFP subunit